METTKDAALIAAEAEFNAIETTMNEGAYADAVLDALSDRSGELQSLIAETPAESLAGAAVKLRLIENRALGGCTPWERQAMKSALFIVEAPA